MAAAADGKREVNSVTWPGMSDVAAIHQWKNGGLYAYSPPLFVGRIQSQFCSMDTATIDSRGSPFVLNSVKPKNGIVVNIANATIEIMGSYPQIYVKNAYVRIENCFFTTVSGTTSIWYTFVIYITVDLTFILKNSQSFIITSLS